MDFRLWWRLNRVAVVIPVLVAVASGVVGIVYAWNLHCPPGITGVDCTTYLIYNPPSSILTLVLAVLPIVTGVSLGIATVGGEIERGTAQFAWSIVPDRRRWLASQVARSLVAVAIVGLVCGAFNMIIIARLNPGHNLPESFVGYGLWGPILVVRGLCAYAIALALGALVRRLLASFSLGLIVAVVVIVSALVIGRSLEPAHVIPNDDPRVDDALGVRSGVLMPDGSFESIWQCAQSQPTDLDIYQGNAWVLAHCPPVGSYIAGDQMPVVELRESSILAVVAAVGLASTFVLVGRRRPQA